MSTPHALGTVETGSRPAVGALVAWDYAVWRVIDVTDRPCDLWEPGDADAVFRTDRRPYVVILRPVLGGKDLHLLSGGRRRARWRVYEDGEHYPACSSCGGPYPCRAKDAETAGRAAMRDVERYITPGVCPACSEPISSRQKALTWDDNVVFPGGPPVTFHTGRGGCRYMAIQYEKQWVAADPERRRASLSCAGVFTKHNDGTYECSALTECPGPMAEHRSCHICRDPECHALGRFGCDATPDLIRRSS